MTIKKIWIELIKKKKRATTVVATVPKEWLCWFSVQEIPSYQDSLGLTTLRCYTYPSVWGVRLQVAEIMQVLETLTQSHCTATNHQWDLGVTSSYLLGTYSTLSIQFSSVQSLSRVWLFVSPWIPYQLNGVIVPAARSLTWNEWNEMVTFIK